MRSLPTAAAARLPSARMATKQPSLSKDWPYPRDSTKNKSKAKDRQNVAFLGQARTKSKQEESDNLGEQWI
jgi:hypothetical protein